MRKFLAFILGLIVSVTSVYAITYEGTLFVTQEMYFVDSGGTTNIIISTNGEIIAENIMSGDTNVLDEAAHTNDNRLFHWVDATILISPPTETNHPVDLETMQMAVVGNSLRLYLYNNDDPTTVGFQQMLTASSDEPESTNTFSSTTNDMSLTNWITETNFPNINALEQGVYELHVHAAKTAGSKDAKIKFRMKIYQTNGTTVTVGTSEDSSSLTGDKEEYDFHLDLSSATNIATSDRVLLEVIAVITGGGSAPTIELYMEGLIDSRFNINVSSGIFMPKSGGIFTGDVFWDGNNASNIGIMQATNVYTLLLQLAGTDLTNTFSASALALSTNLSDYNNDFTFNSDQLAIINNFENRTNVTDTLDWPFIYTNDTYEIRKSFKHVDKERKIDKVYTVCDFNTGVAWVVSGPTNTTWREFSTNVVLTFTTNMNTITTFVDDTFEVGEVVGLKLGGGTWTQGVVTVEYKYSP